MGAPRNYACVLSCEMFQLEEGKKPEPFGSISSEFGEVGEPVSFDELKRRVEVGLKAAAGTVGSGKHPREHIAQWLRANHVGPEISKIADAIERGDYAK